MGEGDWGWGTGEMGVGLELESADRVEVWGCVWLSVLRLWGNLLSFSQTPGWAAGLCSAFFFYSAWERPN